MQWKQNNTMKRYLIIIFLTMAAVPSAAARRAGLAGKAKTAPTEQLLGSVQDSITAVKKAEEKAEMERAKAEKAKAEKALKEQKKLAKAEEKAAWEQMSIPEHMAHYEDQGISHKEAMKLVAKDRGVGKREIYQALLEEE